MIASVRTRNSPLKFIAFVYVLSILAYAVIHITGSALPRNVYLPFQLLPVFIVVFFAGAIGEEVGSGPGTLAGYQHRDDLRAAPVPGSAG